MPKLVSSPLYSIKLRRWVAPYRLLNGNKINAMVSELVKTLFILCSEMKWKIDYKEYPHCSVI